MPTPPPNTGDFDQTAPFSDPFADLASVMMPASVPAMLRHAEFFSIANETLRAAYNRTSAYFNTDIKVTGELGDDEKAAQLEYLRQDMAIYEFLGIAGLDFLTYGSSATSAIQPFIRYVACPKCRAQYRLGEFNARPLYQYKWQHGIAGYCPACRYSGIFADRRRRPIDLPDESRPIILRRWNPHDMRIVFVDSIGQPARFDWIIPADFRTEVRLGLNKPVVEETPWDWLMAATHDENIRFDNKFVHYWAEPALAGLRTRGVGVPRAIINYRQLYYCQILRRMNEVLALGHVVPFRVISPANTSGRDPEAGDILKMAHMGDMKARVMQMYALHRQDQNSIHYSPIPLQMQALGADARQLIPQDVLNQGLETLLNGLDTPVDFYRLNLTTQAAPVALRLLDRLWAPFNYGRNRLLNFIGAKLQFYKGWEKAQYELRRVTLVDDIEKSQLRMQAAQAGLVSRTHALRELDADFKEETRQKLEDMRVEQLEQARFADEQDSFAFGQQVAQAGPPMLPPAGPGGMPPQQPGTAPPGGDPNAQAAGGAPPADANMVPGVPAGSDPLAGLIPQEGAQMDPEEFLGRAQAAAKFLLTIPEGQRFGRLKEIRETSPMFHQMVKGQMDQIRSKARSQGQQQVMQQMGGA